MPVVGITALVPPEVIYACGCRALDVNNLVPSSGLVPKDKLCAWTAIWRDLALMRRIRMDRLVVVAGGDCYNAIVDGERVERSGIATHYFAYPFNGSKSRMREELLKLCQFLGSKMDEDVFDRIAELKKRALEIDRLRTRGKVDSHTGYLTALSGSDMAGGMERYERMLDEVEVGEVDYEHRVALLGTPPVYTDFHSFLEELGLHVVYDEMPYEFIRHTGRTLGQVACSYASYTFARSISTRLGFLKSELKRRDVDGVIHFHQFACHHKLEDPVLREELGKLGYSFITIEADLPSHTPEQTKLRLEAFRERLGEYA